MTHQHVKRRGQVRTQGPGRLGVGSLTVAQPGGARVLTPIPAISVDARAPWRSTEEGHQPAWALREGFPEEGTCNPTLGMGVGVARWNRMWEKSIQGRGSACAKARKRESGAFGHRKTVFSVEMQSGQQGPGGDGALWAPPRWGKVHRHDSGGHAYPWCTELWVRLTLRGKSTERGRVPLGGDGEKGLRR